MRILFTDDDPDARALAFRALRQEFPDADAVEPVDAAEFEAALSAVPAPDLFITDFDLHWSNGLALFEQVRQRGPDCPSIMFTGTGNEDLAVKAIKAGFDDYVVKSPKQFKRLATAARTALERRRERKALREDRDLVLQELYHRLHNNLQLVISLLAFTTRAIADADARRKLGDLAQRIQSLSLLQEQFYRAGEFRRVDLQSYLGDLVDNLVALGGGRIAAKTELGAVQVPVNVAVPLGLIANELIMNTIKHAFPEDESGKLIVELRRDGSTVMLRVADNGVGWPAAQEFSVGNAGLGVRLIQRLAGQIDAQVSFEPSDKGTDCRVTLTTS